MKVGINLLSKMSDGTADMLDNFEVWSEFKSEAVIEFYTSLRFFAYLVDGAMVRVHAQQPRFLVLAATPGPCGRRWAAKRRVLATSG